MNIDIVISVATEGEAAGIAGMVEKAGVSYVGARKIFSGYLEKKPVRILVTGPGIVNTVQALTAAVENSRPSLIIQTGCAGAFKEAGLGVGDIGIATEEIDSHLGTEPENENSPLTDIPFSLITKDNLEIKNRYPVNCELADSAFDAVRQDFNIDKIQVKKGPFVTVSTITATDKRAKRLFEQFGACMEQMEGSGAAHLAIHYDIPFLEIRAASNLVGKRDRSSWNLPLAFERCALAVQGLIRNNK
ncbi:MAG: futalosine hydrolase [Desulfobacteraceae bacterium]|nr:futalosine hydrolase [Desulfobacteraceae bacterium]